jgi:hydroxyacylglutathione hydrolase
MKVEQIYTGCLSEATYFIKSGQASAIVDPLRETQKYLDKIAAEKIFSLPIFMPILFLDT